MKRDMSYSRFRSIAIGGMECPIALFCLMLTYRHGLYTFEELNPETYDFPDPRVDEWLIPAITLLVWIDFIGACFYQRTPDAIGHHMAGIMMMGLISYTEAYRRYILLAMNMILGTSFGLVRIAWLGGYTRLHYSSNLLCLAIIFLFRTPLHLGACYQGVCWIMIFIERDGMFSTLPLVGFFLFFAVLALTVIDIIFWAPWCLKSLQRRSRRVESYSRQGSDDGADPVCIEQTTSELEATSTHQKRA